MIGRLRGVLAWKQPPWLLIDANGVGYELEASLTTFQTLPEIGADVMLHTHLAVREDAHTLYGFATPSERALFRNLIRVTGIGPRVALLILSGMSVDLFGRCVREGDAAALTRLPGIGKKTAERLIIEMRDRVGELGLDPTVVTLPGERSGALAINPVDDAISALVALGYRLPDAARMVQTIAPEGLTSEAIIRQALQASVRR
ncbi:Holliday junction helicase, subunit A [Candidatus Competibacter denitrificans Run_A_D11]|uniref:Holliday junction branch migration complex subunit RuvA n=1 Tax=Candidatus Competibacter denitrificans Run_A_D11 TaxID=1400863 RepID=W6MBF1_9GAMM|nr:Holliday junction branch migration protein RuvA [Candidatus Competibacter denitrificans]CDI04259.1 Holliday junction helicase, subunit A [Candidatus Competibacter denitrificans Run_A_D11]HAS87289.1 Holliday junction branch migration protein RuvA [Candidatus Competibacteraceae bacterium]HRC70602.1 Holliday junction branch migration protein RuvA [Candidatus Competibacter denitrificans]